MTTATRAILAAAAVSLAGAVSAQTAQQSDPLIIREGEGLRRTQLDKMELAPFPADAWAKLSDWKNGNAVSGADISGKVVLICTYSDWYAPAKRGFSLARRMAETYGAQGLVVVCAHHKEGWANAPKPAAPAGAMMLLAHDAQGAFRDALRVDQDPDFYFIDRSGQMRLADVTTESVEEGCKLLLAETPEAAAGTKQRLADEARQRDLDQRRVDALREQVDLTQMPSLPFMDPTADQYKNAKWPELPRDPNNYQNKEAKLEPRPIPLPEANWFPSKPDLKGRAVLIYLWHPDLAMSFDRFMNQADLFQRQRGRDLIVVGVMTNFSGVQNMESEMTESQKDPAKLLKRLETFAKSRKFEHYLTFDPSGAIFDAVKNQNNEIAWPMLIVVSTDRMARWWPVFDSSNQRVIAGVHWLAALDRVLAVDPGVQARRAAEAEWIRQHQGR